MNVDGQLEQEAAAHRHTHAIQWQMLQAAGASKVSNAGITMLKALQRSRVGGIRPQQTAVPPAVHAPGSLVRPLEVLEQPGGRHVVALPVHAHVPGVVAGGHCDHCRPGQGRQAREAAVSGWEGRLSGTGHVLDTEHVGHWSDSCINRCCTRQQLTLSPAHAGPRTYALCGLPGVLDIQPV